jgi:hypothetical protein
MNQGENTLNLKSMLFFCNEVYHKLKFDFPEVSLIGQIEAMLIYPASDMHIKKYSADMKYLVEETYEQYRDISRPQYIE